MAEVVAGTQGPAQGAGLPSAAAELLDSAWQAMQYAHRVADVNLRFSLAYRCALRAGAAVLAVRAGTNKHPGATPAQPRNVWDVLQRVAPELGEWAVYYQSQAALRDIAESGSSDITGRMADDAVREAEQFINHAVRAMVSWVALAQPTAG